MKHSDTLLFNKDNILWMNNLYVNLMMVRNAEERLNYLLKTDGKVYLNEAYNSLGFPSTKTGGMLGWIIENSTMIDFTVIRSDDTTDPDLIITFENLTELC